MKTRKALTLLITSTSLFPTIHAYGSFNGRGEDATISNYTMTNDVEYIVPDWWVEAPPIYSGWTNYGSPIYLTNWLPPISNQTSSFTQSRDYDQNMTQTRYEREQNLAYVDEYRVVATYTERKIVSDTETRKVSVSVSDWTNSGSPHTCTAWSPPAGNYNSGTVFTQTRNCSQNQARAWSYKVDSSLLAARGESRTVIISQSRSATGTKVTSGTWTFIRSSFMNLNDPNLYTSLANSYTGGVRAKLIDVMISPWMDVGDVTPSGSCNQVGYAMALIDEHYNVGGKSLVIIYKCQ